MRPWIAILCALGCTPAGAAAPAWNRVVLVELFTSQGCSSCPAADALVRELPGLGLGRDRVVPLTFHVDYWDELGWKDPFATPAFTERQRRYARSAALRSPDGDSRPAGLYTPQMVIDGGVHFSGARRDLALAQLRRAAAAPPRLSLSATARRQGDDLTLVVTTDRPGADLRVRAALAIKEAHTRVLHGENRGADLAEAAIVRVLSPPVPLAASVSLPLRKPPELRWHDVEVTVFVQSERTLEVAAALSVPTPPPG